ncbi:FtsW/RodA/SpoVE family cell cycle protein [Oceanobacillus kapialis]|uniref:FtsW/RodA/SpoVE family cell cycle protein n=1 Tax=Oceanobacillus kapialis TaxID=481353 RepID=UPI00384F6D2B
MDKRGDSFLSEVTKHVRSKEAKKFIRAELEDHLNEAKNSLKEKGFNNVEAENKAVEQMGSPILLGEKLNKLHRPMIDWWLIILLIIIMGLSFTPVLSLWSTEHTDMSYILRSRIFTVVLGLAIVFGMMRFDYRKLEKYGWVFYLFGVLLLLSLLLFPTHVLNGELVIINGFFTIRSFMALPFLFLAWASFFNNSKLKVWQFVLLFLLSLYLFLVMANFPVTCIYISMVFVMLWWSKLVKKKILLITVLSFFFAGWIIWGNLETYQLDRIMAFLNPENYATEEGYMYLVNREMITSAGWFGTTGLEEFTHQAHTDFVLASLIYDYGYLFAIMLVFVLSLFVTRMFIIANGIQHHFAKLLLVGAITLFVVPVVYNVGMTLGLLPIISISLPFISYGEMPTLFNTFLMGISLSIFRRKSLLIGEVHKGKKNV